MLIIIVFDLKYVVNKYGKKMVEDGYYLEIYLVEIEEKDMLV